SDSLLAPILKNFVVFEDRIQTRPGTAIQATHPDHKPIETLIPYFGVPQALAAATNGKIAHCFDMTEIQSGFTRNSWSWTAFANLGEQDYTVMCNGAEGVWSWDGSNTPAGMVKETITVPTDATWVDPDKLAIVI